MNRLLPILFIITLMCSCSPNENRSELKVYRVISQQYQTEGQLIAAENATIGKDTTELQPLLDALAAKPDDAKLYNPLEGIEIISCSINDGTALLELSGGYLKLKGIAKTLADACCTLTLCALPDVDRLSISVDGAVVTQGLTTSNMLLSGASNEPYEREICLYFTNEAGTLLVPEYRTLSISDGTQPERYVIEELLRAPTSPDLRSPIPEGAELLGISRNGRTCTLNLSAKFLENQPKTATGEVLAIYSLVNSLTSLDTINDVLITIEGKPIEKYLYLTLDSPLTGLDFIENSNLSSINEITARLYFACEGELFGAPCVIDGTGDAQQALLSELMTSSDFDRYHTLFNSNDELKHVSTKQGVCTVSISRSFFERRETGEAELAIDALFLTLIELDDVSSVKIIYSDGTVPLAPVRDLNKPILQINAKIIE